MIYRLFISFFISFFLLIQPVNAVFFDVFDDDPSLSSIQYLEGEDIMNGYPDGSFQPQRLINRAEFIHIIAEAFLNDVSLRQRSCFPDVDRRVWFAESVCKSKNQKIIQGYPDGSFAGEKLINFAEASQILYKLMSDAPASTDQEIWFRPALVFISEKRAIPTSISHFTQQITSGEAAQMIRQILSADPNASSMSYINDELVNDINAYTLTSLRADLLTSLQEPFTSSHEIKLEREVPEEILFRRRRGGGSSSSQENLSFEDSDRTGSETFRRATWIWNHGTSSPQEYVNITLKENMTDIYLSSYEPDWAGEYISLIHEANPNISVQLIAEGHCALEIDPTCGAQHLTLYSDPQQVKEYVKLDAVNTWLTNNTNGLQVSGIHYDVEAYHAPGSYWQCKNGGIYTKCQIDNYLEMVQNVLVPLQQEGLTQSVVWGSSRNTTPDAESSYELDFARLLNDVNYQTAVSDVIILAYHDEHTVADMSAAFSVANSICTEGQCPKIFPAIETEDIGIDVVSFAEEGRVAADSSIQSHIDTYSSSDSFGGVGIHWLYPYSEMK